MVKKLGAGNYTVKLNSPAPVFSLLDSGGNVYHIRTMPKDCSELDVNILHPDTYTASCPCVYNFNGAVKTNGNSISLAIPERFRYRDIIVLHNPYLQGTPARIFTNSMPAKIEVGDKFYSYPKQVRLFILLHEYGHLFYATEWKVDLFALKMFLQMGYNASQAFYALSMILGNSPQSKERIVRLFNSLKEADAIH
jgi:hypothetical protein